MRSNPQSQYIYNHPSIDVVWRCKTGNTFTYDCKKAEQRLVVGRSLIDQVLGGCSIGFDVLYGVKNKYKRIKKTRISKAVLPDCCEFNKEICSERFSAWIATHMLLWWVTQSKDVWRLARMLAFRVGACFFFQIKRNLPLQSRTIAEPCHPGSAGNRDAS